MRYDLLMQSFHTPAALADALSSIGERISPQAIYKWKKHGIPLDRAPQIEKASNGLLKCEQLCPQVMWARAKDGQVIGYSVPVQLSEETESKSLQACRVWQSQSCAHPTANHKRAS